MQVKKVLSYGDGGSTAKNTIVLSKKPTAGSTTVKFEPKVVELVPGYGITCTQRQIDEVNSNGSSSPMKMLRLLMAVFFSEEAMANSSCYGSGNTDQKLDDDIIAACIKYVQDKFKDSGKVVQNKDEEGLEELASSEHLRK
ncbi:uncharacterized protein [Dysidea avara]|uniref:uncharacterized protein n=1 Tax=Dysidea avara TaxID=196820 RepID=UPI003332E79F